MDTELINKSDKSDKKIAEEGHRTDELTGLLNIYSFRLKAEKLIEEGLAKGSTPAVIYVDLYGFHTTNDLHGYKFGDATLKKTAELLRDIFQDDLVCRYIDDKFAVLTLAPHVVIAGRVAEADRRLHDWSDGKTHGLRAGVYDCVSGDNIMKALDRARRTMLAHRMDHIVHCHFFSKKIAAYVKIKDFVLDKFIDAIKNGTIDVLYQPMIGMMSRKVVAIESRVRWKNDKGVELMPDELVPVLEECGITHLLDLYVLRRVSSVAAERIRSGLTYVVLPVNFSCNALAVPNIRSEINAIVREHGLLPKNIGIEVMESSVRANEETMRDLLPQLKADGFHILLDDFGISYGSLHYLRDLDFSYIKLCERFLTNDTPKGRVIITNIIDMAKRLGVLTVVKGIATNEQMAFLRAVGACAGQGDFIVPTLPFYDMTTYLEQHGIEFELRAEIDIFKKMQFINVLDPSAQSYGLPMQAIEEPHSLSITLLDKKTGRMTVPYINSVCLLQASLLGIYSKAMLETALNEPTSKLYPPVRECISHLKSVGDLREFTLRTSSGLSTVRMQLSADTDAYSAYLSLAVNMDIVGSDTIGLMPISDESTKLVASYQLNHPLIEKAGICVFWKDAERRFIGANRSFLDYYGLELRDIIGKTTEDLNIIGDAEKFKRNEEEILAMGTTVIDEAQTIVGGHTRYCQYSETAIVADGANIGIVGFFFDTTKYRLAYERMNKRRIELERFLRYACMTNELVAYVDLDEGSATYYTLKDDGSVAINKKKWVADDFVGKLIPEERALWQVGGRWHVEMRKAISEGRTYRCQEHMVTKDGKTRYLMALFQPTDITASGKTRYIYFRYDNTEEQEKEARSKRTLNIALEAAQKAGEAKGNFLSSMSHEIRTPLNAIIGYLRMANGGDVDHDKLEHILKNSLYAADHLLSLINNILDMSAIGQGKLALSDRPFNLLENAREIYSIFHGQAEQKKVTLKHKYSDIAYPCLIGDAMHLRQILVNVLSNSMKFTPEGGTITLGIEQSMNEDKVLTTFMITDSGIGMTKEELDKLYKPFEQANKDTHQKYGGSGLGMSIVKNLIQLMHGSITVDSTPGVGTSFKITIPFAKAEENEKTDDQPQQKTDLKGRRVLVAEDNEMNREIAKALLEDMGLVVTMAEDGKIAYEKFASSAPAKYDAILMDIQMPTMNGYEATEAIRHSSHPDAGTVPIIALSADVFDADVARAMASGMNDYVTKPFEPSRLAEVLQKLIK